MDFVLTLHSHLPYVLNHGRWPHGSDWLTEATIDTYLPLLEHLRRLATTGTPAPVTIGFTPVLANQLASPTYVMEMEAFFTQRLTACDEAIPSLNATGETRLIPLVHHWRARLMRLRALFHSIDRDIIRAFRSLEEEGRLQIIGSAATHGFLPLLARDESIRLQLAVGRHEHRRLFGRLPTGCWLPECAYRPRGQWAPTPDAPNPGIRRGIEEHLADAGFHFFFTDAHQAHAGIPLGAYGDVPLGAERFDAERHAETRLAQLATNPPIRSPYQAYRLSPERSGRSVSALVRDPRSSMQVWSRQQGYPGDEWYLEFHKIRWPGGLKLWRVSPPGTDIGDKGPYEPARAAERAQGHAAHFAGILAGLAADTNTGRGGVVVAPFDTELFGHWWAEGPDFLEALYERLARQRVVRPRTAGDHLAHVPPKTALRLAAGSWGANGDYSMWLNPETEWTWRRLWPIENAFWDAAPAALENPAAWPVLAQAARELLLAQSSDWQFIISTGAVADYAERRFTEHCDDTEQLIRGLTGTGGVTLEAAQQLAERLARRDDLFPDVLASVATALNGSRGLET